MEKYSLEGMRDYFTNIHDLGLSDFIYDKVIDRLGCHIKPLDYFLLDFSFSSCSSLEEAKSIAILYASHWDDEIYYIPTLLKELKNLMKSNLDTVEIAEKLFK